MCNKLERRLFYKITLCFITQSRKVCFIKKNKGMMLMETGLAHQEVTFFAVYKTYCADVDDINKGEDPFGYGISADGKIYNGTRVD